MADLFHKQGNTSQTPSNGVRLDAKWSNTKGNAYTKDILGSATGMRTHSSLRSSQGAGRGRGKYSLAPINHPNVQKLADPGSALGSHHGNTSLGLMDGHPYGSSFGAVGQSQPLHASDPRTSGPGAVPPRSGGHSSSNQGNGFRGAPGQAGGHQSQLSQDRDRGQRNSRDHRKENIQNIANLQQQHGAGGYSSIRNNQPQYTPDVRKSVRKGAFGHQGPLPHSQSQPGLMSTRRVSNFAGAAASPNFGQNVGGPTSAARALVAMPQSQQNGGGNMYGQPGASDQMMVYQQQPGARPGQGTSQQQVLQKLMQVQLRARDYEHELQQIKSVDQIQIDHSEALSVKRGDLATIPGEVFRCNPAHYKIQSIPLVVKRLECVDRRLFDQLIYECDTFMRFRGHPNIISLYSYWTEKPASPYQFKTLVQLFEDATLGDLMTSVVLAGTRPSNRMVLKYVCDISKGLASLHNCGIIHGGIKPSSLYLSHDNVVMLGALGRVKLDSARQAESLFSKVLMADAMPKALVYWAPELLRQERFTQKADIWALGVTLYQIITGEQPFNTLDEESFRNDVMTGNLDWSRLATSVRLRIIVEQTLQVDPSRRWDASFILSFLQEDFAIEIQKAWRGYRERKRFRDVSQGLVKIQSLARGFVVKRRYAQEKRARHDFSILKIQSVFRGYLARSKFRRQKRALMRAQANVLTRQQRRAFLKLKQDATMAQAYIKRYLAMAWYQRIRHQNESLTNQMRAISDTIGQYNQDANRFKQEFTKDGIAQAPKILDHMTDFEGMQRKAFDQQRSDLPSMVPGLLQVNSDYERLKLENQLLKEQLQGGGSGLPTANRLANRNNKAPLDDEVADFLKDQSLKEELGDKYGELGDMVDRLKSNIKRLADMSKRARPLPLKMQHVYQYSKWDAIHEPYNVVENVLRDDEKVYKALTPTFDFTVNNGNQSFISNIILSPGDCGPQTLEVYTSSQADAWRLVKTFTSTKADIQNLVLPGENLGKYVRIRCVNNVRGGNLVNVRYISIKGLPIDQVPPADFA